MHTQLCCFGQNMLNKYRFSPGLEAQWYDHLALKLSTGKGRKSNCVAICSNKGNGILKGAFQLFIFPSLLLGLSWWLDQVSPSRGNRNILLLKLGLIYKIIVHSICAELSKKTTESLFSRYLFEIELEKAQAQ